MMRADSSGDDALTAIFVAALALPLVSTPTWGVHLGRDSRWRLAAGSIGVGFFVLMLAYMIAFILGPDANADLEAGAGIGLLSLPTLLGLSILTYAGAGVGAAWRHVRALAALAG